MSEIGLGSVAIIGMAGRFPGAGSCVQFWQNVRNGIESLTQYSADTLLAAGVSRSYVNDPRYVKAGGHFENVELFDAAFFEVSPAEAELMDPQHRIFLECAWEALEDAGYASNPGQLRAGIYAGAGINWYLVQNLEARRKRLLASPIRTVTGNDKDYLTTRISYKLGLTGPSVGVQTACSTSLVAVHLACRALINHDADLAMAGGVSIRTPQLSGYFQEEGGMVSPDGHCRAFDAKANGTVFSSGAGIVVLKRLEEAIADKDCIRAIIRGSAINNDGAVKVGFTAPSLDAQAEVIATALEIAEVDARSINYVEAHGTGTILGDPIEVGALTKAFRGWTADRQFCPIGSVKTNIGHLDAAAGVAALIKTVLAIQHNEIPPSLYYETPNPNIDFESSPFVVNTHLRGWDASATPRRAGVSSFGMGGTNAHVVLEEPPRIDVALTTRTYHLLPLSAKNAGALNDNTKALARHLSNTDQASLSDIAFTYQLGRKTFSHRRLICAKNTTEALAIVGHGDQPTITTHPENTSGFALGFMFPGQGAQYVGMGAEIYAGEPAFRTVIDEAAEILKPHWDFDLRDLLFKKSDPNIQRLGQTRWLQPALLAVEYALAVMWCNWGLLPDALIGHSVGEYAAACLAGVMSFSDAMQLVARRAALIQALPEGMMLAVPLRLEEINSLIGDDIAVAALNAPDRAVVSGPVDAVSKLAQRLSKQGVRCMRVDTSHAFHSTMMEPACAEFRELVQQVQLRPPKISFISNLTGDWITHQQAIDPDYWVSHLCQTVRFCDGLRTLGARQETPLLEVGPGNILTSLATRTFTNSSKQLRLFTSMPRDVGSGSSLEHIYQTLGQLWLLGANVKWEEFQKHTPGRRIPLPTYQFQRQRYWLDSTSETAGFTVAPLASDSRSEKPEFHLPMWISASPVPAAAVKHSTNSTCLVLHNENDLVATLIKTLQQRGHDAIGVYCGKMSSETSEQPYNIDPAQPSDFHSLLTSLTKQQKFPFHIIHLLNIDSDGNHCDEAFDKSFYSLLWLVQALGQYDKQITQITVVTSNAHFVKSTDDVRPEKSLVAGICAVAPQEYPNIFCRWVDLDSHDISAESMKPLAALIADELGAPDNQLFVAYRSLRRFTRSFAELRMPDSDSSPGLRQGGIYLITGGFGGIGTKIAESLAYSAKAKLVLTGRTELPSREQWSAVPANVSSEIARRIKIIQKLEQNGATVLYANADVADQPRMSEVVRLAEERFGPIDGLIHAAGVAGGSLIQAKTRESVDRILAPKVKGTQILANLFRDRNLDFFVLCSSLQSILGGIGQTDYCSANAFLDAFAHCEHVAGRHCISANWDTWRGVGMAAHISANGLSPDLATAALAQIVVAPFPQVAISSVEAGTNIRRSNDKIKSPPLSLSIAKTQGDTHPRPELLTPYQAPGTPTEHLVAGIWGRILGIEKVGIDDGFFELGGDSISAIQVVNLLKEELGVSLAPAHLIAASTIRSLVARFDPAPETYTPLEERRTRGEKRRALQMVSR